MNENIDSYDFFEEKGISFVNNDVDEVVENLEETFGNANVKFVDEKIDDGLDDGAYLMMRSYNVITDDYTFYVKLYYGNDNCIVTDYTID